MKTDSRIVRRFAIFDRERLNCEAHASAWLGPAEHEVLATLRDPGRRESWFQARVLAKQLILEQEHCPETDARAVEIVSRDERGRGRRPQVLLAGRAAKWSLSISHTAGAVLVALCTAPSVSIGVDLVRLGPLGTGFPRAWFDPTEQELAATGDAFEACRLWAIKEAVYKAANAEDPFAPRQIRVRKTTDGDYTCGYRGVDLGDRCRVDTWEYEGHVAALAALSGLFVLKERCASKEDPTTGHLTVENRCFGMEASNHRATFPCGPVAPAASVPTTLRRNR